MDILRVIKSRRSIRKYSKKNIDPVRVELILEAGRWAPSGLNNQPWKFLVVRDKKEKEALGGFTEYGEIIRRADICICVFLDKRESYHREKDIMAVGACVENMLLEACSLGIGSCWLGEILNKRKKAEQFLVADKKLELMAVIALGIPCGEKVTGRRKKLSKIML